MALALDPIAPTPQTQPYSPSPNPSPSPSPNPTQGHAGGGAAAAGERRAQGPDGEALDDAAGEHPRVLHGGRASPSPSPNRIAVAVTLALTLNQALALTLALVLALALALILTSTPTLALLDAQAMEKKEAAVRAYRNGMERAEARLKQTLEATALAIEKAGAADGTIGGLRQALESLQAEHSATSAKLAQLQMSTTLQDLEEAEATVKEMEGEIRDLKAENEELHRRLEELSSRVGANHRKMKVGRVQAAAPCASAATRCNRRLPLRRRPPYVLPGGAHAQPAEDQLQRGAARHPRSRTAKCDGGDGGGGGAEGAADARGDARSRDAAAGARGAQDPTKRRVTQGAHSERTPGGRRAPL